MINRPILVMQSKNLWDFLFPSSNKSWIMTSSAKLHMGQAAHNFPPCWKKHVSTVYTLRKTDCREVIWCLPILCTHSINPVITRGYLKVGIENQSKSLISQTGLTKATARELSKKLGNVIMTLFLLSSHSIYLDFGFILYFGKMVKII